jgi:hypothetical protein
MIEITRGDLITFRFVPKDADGNLVTPSNVNLYLNYTHADGTTVTDAPIAMTFDAPNQRWTCQFDTSVCLPSTLNGSVRTIAPVSAVDFFRAIVANPSNPNPAED